MVLLKMSVDVVHGCSTGETLAVNTPLSVEPWLALEMTFQEPTYKKLVVMIIAGTLFFFAYCIIEQYIL